MTIKERLGAYLGAWKISGLTDAAASRLESLARLLLEANERMNLTSVRDFDGVLERHIADSLAIYGAVKPSGRALDLGCGGGFPGLPVKIFDECGAKAVESITMLDSTAKKLGFVSDAARELGMTGVETLPSRAEDAGRESSRREGYDIVMSRAVAELPVLLELAMPLVRVGGTMAAMKSAKELSDRRAAERVAAKLGGRVEGVWEYRLGERDFAVLTVKKISRVSTEYPRVYAQIVKKPLA